MQENIGFTQSNILASASAQGRSAAFVAALAFLLPQEGVYFEIVAGDNGGATCCGVTQSCYDMYRSAHVLPSRSVQLITAGEVSSIYWEQNWNALGLDRFQYEVGLPLFDSSVNCGNGEAVLFLQRALKVTDDGVLGPATLAAEHDFVVAHGALALGSTILSFRRVYYDEIGAEHANDEQFEADWHRRCNDVQAAIEAYASARSK